MGCVRNHRGFGGVPELLLADFRLCLNFQFKARLTNAEGADSARHSHSWWFIAEVVYVQRMFEVDAYV